MDAEDSFESDGDLFVSNVADFPSLLTGNKVELIVDTLERTGEDELLVTGALCPKADVKVRLHLRGIWSQTPLTTGYRLKVFDPRGYNPTLNVNPSDSSVAVSMHVDNTHGLVVVEPNVLISSTTISQSFYCQRKAVLLERFRGAGSSSAAMLIGTCIHTLFQSALAEKDKLIDEKWLLKKFQESILPGAALQMISIKLTPEALLNDVTPYFRIIAEWINQYTRSAGGPVKHLQGSHVITEIADIEENNWMPAIGVKGKIDVTLKVRNVNNGKEFAAPLELKTGNSKMSFDHNGQVLLYSMMLSLKKNVGSIEPGFLLYLKDGSLRTVLPKAMDLKGIMKCRNEIASFLATIEINSLPPPLTSSRFCDKCPMASACAIYERMSDGCDTSAEMKEFSTSITSHLQPSHLEYFVKWTRWTMMEWSTADFQTMNAKALWTMSAKKREEKGHCIANATLVSQEVVDSSALLVFTRENAPREVVKKGDYIIISTDYYFALMTGFLVSFTGDNITVRCEKTMPADFVGRRFHLDKHESFTTHSLNLANVAALMDNTKRSGRLRELIIDKKPAEKRAVSKKDFDGVVPFMKNLNKKQSTAVLKALFIKDYLLIEGFPGSGKTTTICSLVQCLLKLGRTVLITAYTNSAVDNIMRKLQKVVSNDKLLRIGTSSVHADVRDITLDAKMGSAAPSERYELMRGILENTPIVATTCLMASSHSLFSWRRFDMCIVDEASLVTENTILSSLMLCDAFVLVGDKHQLSPLVLNRTARDEGMATSLFERLSENTDFVVSLTAQYRMNRVISDLCSNIFYNGSLICGSDDVAEQTLPLEDVENRSPSHIGDFKSLLSPSLEDSIVIVDTSVRPEAKYLEKAGKSRGDVYNEGEAECVADICAAFLKNGVSAQDIGVMATYRHQVKIISDTLEDPRIEVNTVDQYQGREKKVMIFSLVHTDPSKNCELLMDRRRVNVALSRAKCKLVIVGNVARCEEYPVMKQIFGSVNRKTEASQV